MTSTLCKSTKIALHHLRQNLDLVLGTGSLKSSRAIEYVKTPIEKVHYQIQKHVKRHSHQHKNEAGPAFTPGVVYLRSQTR